LTLEIRSFGAKLYALDAFPDGSQQTHTLGFTFSAFMTPKKQGASYLFLSAHLISCMTIVLFQFLNQSLLKDTYKYYSQKVNMQISQE